MFLTNVFVLFFSDMESTKDMDDPMTTITPIYMTPIRGPISTHSNDNDEIIEYKLGETSTSAVPENEKEHTAEIKDKEPAQPASKSESGAPDSAAVRLSSVSLLSVLTTILTYILVKQTIYNA